MRHLRTVIVGPGGRRGSATLIPQSHADLVECPRVAALTTIMPNGPHTSVVWCDFDGVFVRVIGNVALGVGALSYAGTFNIGVVADRDAHPDIDVFAAGVRDELHALGVSTYPGSSRAGADALGACPHRDSQPAVDRRDDVRSSPKPQVISEPS